MKQLLALWKMVRPLNLLILGLTTWIIYFVFNDPETRETIEGSLVILTSILVCAFGYLINDYYDVESDQVNKPDKMHIGNTIARSTVLWVSLFFAAVSIALGFYLGEDSYLAWIPILSVALVFHYSWYLQHTPLLGNLLVSFLTALSLIYPMGFGDWFIYPNYTWSSLDVFFPFVLFSFLATLGREIAKDAEDREGDSKVGAKTLAVLLRNGVKWVILAVLLLHLFPFTMEGVLEEIKYWLDPPSAQGIGLCVTLFLLLAVHFTLVYRTIRAQVKADYSALSKLFKLLMFLGIVGFLQYILYVR